MIRKNTESVGKKVAILAGKILLSQTPLILIWFMAMTGAVIYAEALQASLKYATFSFPLRGYLISGFIVGLFLTSLYFCIKNKLYSYMVIGLFITSLILITFVCFLFLSHALDFFITQYLFMHDGGICLVIGKPAYHPDARTAETFKNFCSLTQQLFPITKF